MRRSTTPVVAGVAVVVAAAAAAAVDDEDCIQWRWTMKMAFNGGRSFRRQWWWGLRIGDGEAAMEIDISGGGWRRRASAFDGGNGRRWAFVFDGGNGQQLWQQWTIEKAFNGGSGGDG